MLSTEMNPKRDPETEFTMTATAGDRLPHLTREDRSRRCCRLPSFALAIEVLYQVRHPFTGKGAELTPHLHGSHVPATRRAIVAREMPREAAHLR